VAVVDRSVIVRDVRVHYRDWGDSDAPPLVLVHGLGAHAGWWDDVVERMSDRYHVLVPDLRGHDETAWTDDYSWESFVSDIAAFGPAIGIPHYALFGHSLGGWIGYMVAAWHPHAVARLVIAETGPPPPWPPTTGSSEPPEPRFEIFATPEDAVASVQRAVPLSNPTLLRRAVLSGLVPNPHGGWTWRSDPRLQRAVWRGRLRPGHDLEWAALRSISCPTLVIRGEHNLPVDVGEAIVKAIPSDAQLVTIPESGHDLANQNPSALVAAIRSFLDSGD
jgi:pimeloyl-ACP methyl ester carboxylesterase